MRNRFKGALLSLLIGAIPGIAWPRSAPSLGEVRKEERDPQVLGRQPMRKPLVDLTNFVADLITDQSTRDEQVPGIDYFVINLGKELKKYGSDQPRKDILDNSLEARRTMRDGHADLRRGVALMLDARDVLKGVNEKLQPLVEENKRSMEAIGESFDGLRSCAEGLRSERPESTERDPDDSKLQGLRDLSSDLNPLPEELKRAAEKLDEAKSWLENAKGRAEEIEQYRQKALKLDKAALDRLAKSRTRNVDLDVDKEITSEKVIRNERDWFKRTVEKALKIHAAMERLAGQDSGLGAAVARAMSADQAAQRAKASLEEHVPKVVKNAATVAALGMPYDDCGGVVECQRPIVAKAEKQTREARDSSDASKEAVDAAKEAAEKSEAGARACDEKVGDLVEKQLGDRSKDELTQELGDLWVDVPRPKQPPPSRDNRNGQKSSKAIPPSFRSGLDNTSSGAMIRQYGEGAYSD